MLIYSSHISYPTFTRGSKNLMIFWGQLLKFPPTPQRVDIFCLAPDEKHPNQPALLTADFFVGQKNHRLPCGACLKVAYFLGHNISKPNFLTSQTPFFLTKICFKTDLWKKRTTLLLKWSPKKWMNFTMLFPLDPTCWIWEKTKTPESWGRGTDPLHGPYQIGPCIE